MVQIEIRIARGLSPPVHTFTGVLSERWEMFFIFGIWKGPFTLITFLLDPERDRSNIDGGS